MPELPEVETVVRGLSKRLLGRRISSVDVRGAGVVKGDAHRFSQDLNQAAVRRIQRHGKAMYLTVGTEGPSRRVLRIHLGMTGQLVFEPKGRPLSKHTHVVFHLDDGAEELQYRDMRKFGSLEVKPAGTNLPSTPDAWLASEAELFSALRRRSGMIKHALLNQHVIAGLGNIYVDESLHLARLHPRKNLARVSDSALKDLCRVIRATLGRSIRQGGTSFRNYVDTSGRRGGFLNWLKVYGRTGLACASCRTVIRRIVVAGRGTHFCPTCQRAPR